MDVVRRFQVLLFLSLTLSACSQNKTAEDVFSKSNSSCGAEAIADQFIVQWKDGRITKEAATDKDSFLKEFVQPNLENIELAEHDYRIQLQDSIAISQNVEAAAFADNWGADNVNVVGAWQKDIRGSGIIVGVVDSGVSVFHNQLVSQIAYNKGESGTDSLGRDKRSNGVDDDGNGYIDDWAGFDFSTNQASTSDNGEHGTHVSGIMVAEHHDTEIRTGYVQGIAPEAKILPATFLGENGGDISDGIRAIDYAVLRGARVINASWGGAFCSLALKQRIAKLQNQGVIFVAASGNSGQNIDIVESYPASFRLANQFTVGAIGIRNGMAEFSNFGDASVHLFAPGVEIVSTIPNNKVASMDGTSMATPFVTAAVALLLGHRPTASAEQIREALYRSASQDRLYRNASHGRLNISSAIDALEDLVP